VAVVEAEEEEVEAVEEEVHDSEVMPSCFLAAVAVRQYSYRASLNVLVSLSL